MSNIDDEILKYEDAIWYTINKDYPTLKYDEDAFQEGRIAIWKALENYDESSGVPFKIYVYLRIRWRIGKYLQNLLNKYYKDGQRIETPTPFMQIEDDEKTFFKGVEDKSIPDMTDYIYSKDLIPRIKSSLSDIELKIMSLRTSGLTFREIGEHLGFSKQYAHNVYLTATRKCKKIIMEDCDGEL